MAGSVRINAPHVVHETIDGETILIHLKTGIYYSLDGVGSELWVVLAGGTNVASLLAAATERYLGDPGEIEAGVSALVQELVREGLLIEQEEPTAAGASSGFPPGRSASLLRSSMRTTTCSSSCWSIRFTTSMR